MSLSTVHSVAVYVWWCVCVLLVDGKHLRQREGWQRWVVQGQTPGQPGFPPGPGEEFCNGHLPALVYSETSLIRTPVGQKKVSFIERCPHFRG